MTTNFLHNAQAWLDIGGNDTAAEIAHQPSMWRELAQVLAASQKDIEAFLGGCLQNPKQRVILTGAGSSAYIGEIAADHLNALLPCEVRAVATTSLLTHSELYLDADVPTLLVSFARSGNSPESVAAVTLARSVVRELRCLNITCNASGQLAVQAPQDGTAYNLLMPAGSCDRAFAMTSSFTCMLLAVLCVLSPGWPLGRLAGLGALGEQALYTWSQTVAAVGQRRVDRVVYLGSGPLEALAKEAALKVLELTTGRVIAMANTPLGFRHGPKAVLDSQTMVIMFRSSKPLARRYEQDLLDELEREQVVGCCLTVGPQADLTLEVPGWADAWLAPLWLLVAQQFALHQSALLKLRPDSPFVGGTLNRVVQGVTIYEHETV